MSTEKSKSLVNLSTVGDAAIFLELSESTARRFIAADDVGETADVSTLS